MYLSMCQVADIHLWATHFHIPDFIDAMLAVI